GQVVRRQWDFGVSVVVEAQPVHEGGFARGGFPALFRATPGCPVGEPAECFAASFVFFLRVELHGDLAEDLCVAGGCSTRASPVQVGRGRSAEPENSSRGERVSPVEPSLYGVTSSLVIV